MRVYEHAFSVEVLPTSLIRGDIRANLLRRDAPDGLSPLGYLGRPSPVEVLPIGLILKSLHFVVTLFVQNIVRFRYAFR